MAGPLVAPGAARSGLRAPRWPACFARPGITRRLPFASRSRGQGSSALAGTLPDGASSPAPRSLANLPDPGMAGQQHGPPGDSGPLLALWLLGASAAPAGDKAACVRPSVRLSVRPPAAFLPQQASPRAFPARNRPSLCDRRSNTAIQWPGCRTAHAGTRGTIRVAFDHQCLSIGLGKCFLDGSQIECAAGRCWHL